MAKHTENGFSIHATNAISSNVYTSLEYENASNTERTTGFVPGNSIKVVNVNTGLKETTSFVTAYLDALMDLCDTLQASPLLYDSFAIEDDFETAKGKFKTIMSNLLDNTINSFMTGSNITSDIDANSHKVKNVVAPTNDGDAANKKYVDDAVSTLNTSITNLRNDMNNTKQSKLYCHRIYLTIQAGFVDEGFMSDTYLTFNMINTNNTAYTVNSANDIFDELSDLLTDLSPSTTMPLACSGYIHGNSSYSMITNVEFKYGLVDGATQNYLQITCFENGTITTKKLTYTAILVYEQGTTITDVVEAL